MGIRDQLVRWMPPALSQRFNLGQYPQFLADYYSQFAYAGSLYPLQLNQSMSGWQKTEEISATLPNYMISLGKSPPAFAAQMVRASVLSMARFTFRSRPNSSTPRRTFGNADLRLLEQPWPNATTGELISRMEWSAGLAGNAYVLRQPNRLRVLRPDWVAIVYGSQSEPDDPKGALDGEVIGYAYRNGGFVANNPNEIQVLLPEQVAHWSPLPDPLSPGLGMSWITPALRDIQADNSALEYKLGYFTNGATPNLVIKGVPGVTPDAFKTWVDKFEGDHRGAGNAFKTIYLSTGADATVVGSNLQQLDLSSITSHGETRVSFLSRVPAVLLGIAAGLKGSSLNAGNYGEARRNFADSWIYPTLQDLCSAVSPLITMPGGAELWFDVADIPLLREDALDAANIEQVKQQSIVAYVNGGFTPESAIKAVMGQDISQLKHTGLVSVQLQPPGTVAPVTQPAVPDNTNGNGGPPAQASREIERADLQPMMVLGERSIVVENNFQPPAAPNVIVEAPPPTQVTIDAPITVEAAQPASIVNEFASPSFTFDAPITVEAGQPAQVNVTNQYEIPVQPAPNITVDAPITVEAGPAPEVIVNNSYELPQQPAPIVTVEAPVTVNLPSDPPSSGVDVLYDNEGKVVGTRPRGKGKH